MKPNHPLNRAIFRLCLLSTPSEHVLKLDFGTLHNISVLLRRHHLPRWWRETNPSFNAVFSRILVSWLSNAKEKEDGEMCKFHICTGMPKYTATDNVTFIPQNCISTECWEIGQSPLTGENRVSLLSKFRSCETGKKCNRDNSICGIYTCSRALTSRQQCAINSSPITPIVSAQKSELSETARVPSGVTQSW